MSRKTLLTAAELEQIPDDDSVQLELDEGELITMPPAGEHHGYLEGRLFRLIANFAEDRGLGRVYGGDTGFRLSDDTVRCPDVSFVRAERVAALRSRGFANGAPDLAVEVVSPSQSAGRLTRKVRQYFAAGCHTVWIVDPERREIEVFEASGRDRALSGEDMLEAPELLPGFSVAPGQVFDA